MYYVRAMVQAYRQIYGVGYTVFYGYGPICKTSYNLRGYWRYCYMPTNFTLFSLNVKFK